MEKDYNYFAQEQLAKFGKVLKLCECGCGFPTPIYKSSKGEARKGNPAKRIKGHNPGKDKNRKPILPEKLCTGCNQIKLSTSEFFCVDSSKRDGLSTRCKICKIAATGRWTANNQEKLNAYHVKYRIDNQEKIRKASKDWREKNLEHARQRIRDWRKLNPGIRPCQKIWRQNNKDKVRISTIKCKQKRRAKVLGAETLEIDYKKIYDEHNGKCGICDVEISFNETHWDHIIPLSKDGAHAANNLQPSHGFCNSVKGDRSLEWARERIQFLLAQKLAQN